MNRRNTPAPIIYHPAVLYGGEFRTKHIILEIYDAMQRAVESGQPYQTLLDPPPADARVSATRHV